MRSSLLTIGSIFIVASGLFHLYVFYLESIIWHKPKTWTVFGIPSQEHAEIIRPMAFNQGFYNLFLAVGTLIGIVLLAVNQTIGFTIAIFSAASMSLAGTVLFISAKKSRRAALLQFMPPALGILFVVIGLQQVR